MISKILPWKIFNFSLVEGDTHISIILATYIPLELTPTNNTYTHSVLKYVDYITTKC